jgi:hypothetical protein
MVSVDEMVERYGSCINLVRDGPLQVRREDYLTRVLGKIDITFYSMDRTAVRGAEGLSYVIFVCDDEIVRRYFIDKNFENSQLFPLLGELGFPPGVSAFLRRHTKDEAERLIPNSRVYQALGLPRRRILEFKRK